MTTQNLEVGQTVRYDNVNLMDRTGQLIEIGKQQANINGYTVYGDCKVKWTGYPNTSVEFMRNLVVA